MSKAARIRSMCPAEIRVDTDEWSNGDIYELERITRTSTTRKEINFVRDDEIRVLVDENSLRDLAMVLYLSQKYL